MRLSVPELRSLGRRELRVLLYARNCTCHDSTCDVCGVRCPISLADGWDVSYPVRCNNGHMYDATFLKDWVEHHPGAPSVQVIPGVAIHAVHTVRVPFSNAVRIALGLLQWRPRTKEAACQTETGARTGRASASVSPPSPPRSPAPPLQTRRLPRHHAFPRAVVRNAPQVVCAFAWPPAVRAGCGTLCASTNTSPR